MGGGDGSDIPPPAPTRPASAATATGDATAGGGVRRGGVLSHVVGVYAVGSGKRVRGLALDAAVGAPTCVTALGFSDNSRLLVTQCGEPDHMLMVWRWYLGKLILVLRHEWPVLGAAFSPVDDTLLGVVGASTVCWWARFWGEEGGGGLGGGRRGGVGGFMGGGGSREWEGGHTLGGEHHQSCRMHTCPGQLCPTTTWCVSPAPCPPYSLPITPWLTLLTTLTICLCL